MSHMGHCDLLIGWNLYLDIRQTVPLDGHSSLKVTELAQQYLPGPFQDSWLFVA